MKLHSLYSIPLACLLLVLPVMSDTSYAQSPESITESKVLAIIGSVDSASRKRNVAGIVAPLASDVKIKVTLYSPASGKEQVLNLNKQQYVLNVRHIMRRIRAYQVERKNTRVKIYDDGKTAMVTGDVYESLTIQQATLRAVSTETTIFNLRAGKIVVTSLESRTRFY